MFSGAAETIESVEAFMKSSLELQDYAKDLICAVYGMKPGVEVWRWQGKSL